jgi:PD-(D/E)XK nuclease superfamily
MTTNVIDLFSRGNQELFHSAFIAWLLDEHGSHGLSSGFLEAFTAGLPAQIADRLTVPLAVRTEWRSGGSRFDILLEPRSASPASTPFKGLVLENKIKSFGEAVQLDRYLAQGFDVLVLALLPETLDDTAKRNYPWTVPRLQLKVYAATRCGVWSGRA